MNTHEELGKSLQDAFAKCASANSVKRLDRHFDTRVDALSARIDELEKEEGSEAWKEIVRLGNEAFALTEKEQSIPKELDDLDEKQANALGKRIANALYLRLYTKTDLFGTTSGTKNYQGIGRMVARMVDEERERDED